jgi:hypothetical protein
MCGRDWLFKQALLTYGRRGILRRIRSDRGHITAGRPERQSVLRSHSGQPDAGVGLSTVSMLRPLRYPHAVIWRSME